MLWFVGVAILSCLRSLKVSAYSVFWQLSKFSAFCLAVLLFRYIIIFSAVLFYDVPSSSRKRIIWKLFWYLLPVVFDEMLLMSCTGSEGSLSWSYWYQVLYCIQFISENTAKIIFRRSVFYLAVRGVGLVGLIISSVSVSFSSSFWSLHNVIL